MYLPTFSESRHLDHSITLSSPVFSSEVTTLPSKSARASAFNNLSTAIFQLQITKTGAVPESTMYMKLTLHTNCGYAFHKSMTNSYDMEAQSTVDAK